jgi:hypothetical protein
MTIERRRKLYGPSQTSHIKSKYTIAQRYLVNNTLSEDTKTKQTRRFYIAIVQSIAAEQMLGIPHSFRTIEGIRQFFIFFRRSLLSLIVGHLRVDSFVRYFKKEMQHVSEATELLGKLEKSTNKLYFIEEHWDEITRFLNAEQLHEMFKIHSVPIMDEWIYFERELLSHITKIEQRQHKISDLIILFEKIRHVEHHTGIVLEPYIFSAKEWRQNRDIYSDFMDEMSEDALQFDLPYRFGVDGKKEESQ